MNKDASDDGTVPFDGFDTFDVPLGDLLRGERATIGKSLLDVERELKIKAAHIAAIENADLSVFATKGFVAGYVRSYARYLGMDPEWTFRRFSQEAGFYGVHGESAAQARGAKRVFGEAPARVSPNDVMSSARVSFAPQRESIFSNLEPGALGSALVLLALVGVIGYGAWSVLTEIQRVQFVPVEEEPTMTASLDPIETAGVMSMASAELPDAATPRVPVMDPIDPIFRPQALDMPVMTPRDQAIATLDPDTVGDYASAPRIQAPAQDEGYELASAVQVTEEPQGDEVILFAVRPSWIRVRSVSGTILFEGTLDSGDSYALPEGAEMPTLRAGNSGSLYFAVNGVTLGPAGPGTSIARDVVLTADALSESYVMADAAADPDLPRVASLVLGDEGN
ncbi:helix-turn-helix domain-containing protein [Nioella nitratireducens]|uniref:helix-turn-helix domain-containing protein n=1 Tax=Nioella nitratireducens TaxID=1287720 RepID=UPI000ADD9A2F|nr:helix-turn-helix domain-containing protein [Nioella nitratireducens]